MAAISTTAVDAGLERLARWYGFRNPDAIADFMREHPDVVAPLEDAVAIVPCYFGEDSALKLVVETAIDADGRPELFAMIRTSLPTSSALDALAGFDEGWGFDALKRTGGDVTFTVESM